MAGAQPLQTGAAEDGPMAAAPFVSGRRQNHLLNREGGAAQCAATLVPDQPVGGVAHDGLRPRATAAKVRSVVMSKVLNGRPGHGQDVTITPSADTPDSRPRRS
jgi:hypothetical protein